ncbi:oligopeptide/dipeptide ABC transporter ATP-binding protein [uncultured Acetatifactor sp.]|jgi:oligopeptide transport system ATP-binding protein|uniref:oligopeptide/dipeptide ABC transporter ATP-binding protein n=2 Tax=uncultured Acetatifactor sp. TaxID=1671927 RepID=UPI00260E09DB|nr:oligopeptide/dipeptide ABC transporter ATP-binding protein [uncultured Acetatifactor sp.]MCI9651632.1 ATP-binding cassette domain-containing protein [Lachnospiraceae bacterium]
MEDKKVLLSVKNLHVKFRVRGRILTAIRGIDLDIYENESIAIVGESGSGKSVLTKTFAGMTDSNGFIDEGRLILNDPELAETYVKLTSGGRQLMKSTLSRLNSISGYELGVETYRKMRELEAEKKSRESLSEEERAAIENELGDMKFKRANLFNEKQTYDPRHEKDRIKAADRMLKEYGEKIKALESKEAAEEKARKAEAAKDTAFIQRYNKQMAELKAKYEQEIKGQISEETKKRNEILSKEIHLSVGRYGLMKRLQLTFKLLAVLKQAMQTGVDLDDEEQRNAVFDKVAFRVKYLDETSDRLHGICVLNLANVKYARDWQQIRGRRIATVFQDPMTSLNPIVTIGKQITSVIMRHQGCSETEARRRAIELMHKVGIPNAESRFDDYPFQYSGGMRQRIVIAIALSCQPKILICDEPTTALDVTIQAQILQLIKDLQKEFGFTTVFITHDLGVVANVADRVAVLYAGQMVEVGTAEEVFYDPRHPYTWALLSSLPQLAQRNTELYSITGTPPSLYNSITGDAFAPRNPYCLKIDTLEEPPMFRVTDTHYAKTWLLDPRSAKVEKPEGIRDIHNKLMEAFNI